jgi:membrane protease YdiL (CAAX protease family)
MPNADATGWIISGLLSALLQVLALGAIPLLVHCIWFRKREPLAKFLGLYAPERQSVFTALGVAAVVLLSFAALSRWSHLDLLSGPSTVASRFERMNPPFVAGICMLLSAYLQTALSEEIFFRGFIAKRSMAAFGATIGNVLQAALFAALHVALILRLAGSVSGWQALAFGLLVGLGGASLGYLNEVKGNGSIIPSWLAHGTLNLMTYLWVRFF